MSKEGRHFRFVQILITLIPIIFLLQSFLILYPGGDIVASGEKEQTRSGDVEIDMDSVPNFDIQFMIEPDVDSLSELYQRKWSRMPPGSSAIQWIIISNMGPINDTYTIRLAEPNRETGWNWYFYDLRSLETDVHLTSAHIRDQMGKGGPSFKTFRIMIEAPIDASRSAKIPVRISAISDSLFSDVTERAYEDHDEMTIVIYDHCYLMLKPNHPRIYYVDSGENVILNLPLTNLGNKAVITVDLRVIEDNFWKTSYRHFESMYSSNFYMLDYNWTEKTVDIPQGKTIMTELKVKLNQTFGGDEEDVHQFRIFVSIRGAPNYYETRTVTIIVNKRTELEADINGGKDIDISPEEEKRVDLSIRNFEWSEDIIKDIYLIEPDGVELTTYNRTGNITDRFEIPGDKTKVIDVGFKLEKDIPPGKIKRQLFIQPMYEDPIILDITLNILEKKDLKILTPDTYFTEVIPMGLDEEKRVTFGIRNDGNTEQTVIMDIMRTIMREGEYNPTAHESGWSTTLEWIAQVKEPAHMIPLQFEGSPTNTSGFEEDAGYLVSKGVAAYGIPFSIEPKETIWMGFVIKNPFFIRDTLVQPYPVKVVLYSEMDTIIDERDMVIDVRYPDLEFDGKLNLTDELGKPLISGKNGQKVFFTANVANKGSWYSNRTLVNILADDKVIDQLWMISLCPGQSTVLIGNFTVEGDIDRIELQIDPNNDLIELDDQFMEGSLPNANTIRTPLLVEDDDNNSTLIVSIILFTLLAVVLLGVGIWLYLWMKKVSLFPNREQR